MSSEDRDRLGLFQKGNKVAAGNPNNRRMQQLRRELLDAVTTPDVVAVVGKLVELAKGGDVQAAKLYLEYAIGKPTQAIELSGPEGGPVDATAILSTILVALHDNPEARFKVAAAFRSIGTDGMERPGPGA